MEIIEYVWSDWFVHYILSNSLGIPFEFYILLLLSSFWLIYLILKKLIW